MATSARSTLDREIDYPTSDGKPMAETDLHRQIMIDLITTLQTRYEADPRVYVSGNLLLFYERGNKRRHVAPDVFVVFGVAKRPRLNYLLWNEGKGPDVVIEVTSKTTRREDQAKKLALYRDVLGVPEYFQFDPTEDYLKPSLQGHRLVAGTYEPIAPLAGRLPSAVLGLHLEREGPQLRLFDPATGRWLPTPEERAAEEQARAANAEARAAEEQARAAEEQARAANAEARAAEEQARAANAEARAVSAETRAAEIEAENQRLRRDLEALQQQRNARDD